MRARTNMLMSLALMLGAMLGAMPGLTMAESTEPARIPEGPTPEQIKAQQKRERKARKRKEQG